MKKKVIGLLAAAALVSVAAAGIGTAHAYFTTYVEAKGSRTIHLGDVTEIKEGYDDWIKTITVANTDESPQAVWVRVKALTGSAYADGLVYEGDGWSKGDGGYWYYDTAVEPGGESGPLDIQINKIPEDAAAGDEFNVIVVYETTPAVQDGADEKGNIKYEAADWGSADVAVEEEGE